MKTLLTFEPCSSLSIEHLKNTNMDQVFFFIIAISLALLVGKWGSTRKIGFGWAFGLSLFNIFLGIIAVACSKKKDNGVDNLKNSEK